MNESISLADARPRPSNAALAGALVLLGGADVRGPPGGTAEAALAAVGGRGRRVAAAAAAQRRGRVGVRGSPRARQRVDADAVRRSPVTVAVRQSYFGVQHRKKLLLEKMRTSPKTLIDFFHPIQTQKYMNQLHTHTKLCKMFFLLIQGKLSALK